MDVSLVAAEPSDLALLENLFQFYSYDFSEMLGNRIGTDGKFRARSFDAYWQDPWRLPFLLRSDRDIAGFALIHRKSHITLDASTWDVAEFFVMRQYRRQGVGSQAALQIFEQFRGRWEVRQIHANFAAISFWRTVVARHTGGRFSESTYDDERWRGLVQTFDNT